MPRPRGADAAGLLLRELELHPPAEEWHRRNMFGGLWTDTEDLGPLDDIPKPSSSDSFELDLLKDYDNYNGPQGLWPKKRRLSERDAAFGLKISVGLGPYLGVMGSRRDVLTAVWRKGLEGVWYKRRINSEIKRKYQDTGLSLQCMCHLKFVQVHDVLGCVNGKETWSYVRKGNEVHPPCDSQAIQRITEEANAGDCSRPSNEPLHYQAVVEVKEYIILARGAIDCKLRRNCTINST